MRAAAASELQLLLFDPAELCVVNYWAVATVLAKCGSQEPFVVAILDSIFSVLF